MRSLGNKNRHEINIIFVVFEVARRFLNGEVLRGSGVAGGAALNGLVFITGGSAVGISRSGSAWLLFFRFVGEFHKSIFHDSLFVWVIDKV